jgi:hypothetical protein
MRTDLFMNPTDAQVRAAHESGRTSRPTSENPYVVAGEATNALQWAWDLGRRETVYVVAEIKQSAQHRAALAAPDPRRWPFAKERV